MLQRDVGDVSDDDTEANNEFVSHISEESETISTYTMDDATSSKQKPSMKRRHVSCFLSNGCERPPQAPAHRQQQKQSPISGIKKAVMMVTTAMIIISQYFFRRS